MIVDLWLGLKGLKPLGSSNRLRRGHKFDGLRVGLVLTEGSVSGE